MDFQTFLKNKNGYNTVYIVINRLGKRPISIPYIKDITALDMAQLFINRIYRIFSPLDSIMSDYGP